MSTVWLAILAVPTPGTPGPPPARRTVPARAAVQIPNWRRLAWRSQEPLVFAMSVAAYEGTLGPLGTPALAAAAGLAALFVGLRRVSGLGDEHARARRELETSRTQLSGVEARWERELTLAHSRFAAERRRLDALRAEHVAIEQELRLAPDVRQREDQLRRYLDGHTIAANVVPGIGARRIALLTSRGIVTAADVTAMALRAVSDLPESHARALLAWRWSIESAFQFDPLLRLDPGERAGIDTRFARRRTEIERALAAGPEVLQQLGTVASQLRGTLARELDVQQRALATATANAAVLSSRWPDLRVVALVWMAIITLIAKWADDAGPGGPNTPDPAVPIAEVPAVRTDQPSYLLRNPAIPGADAQQRLAGRPGSGQRSCSPDYFCEFQVDRPAEALPGTIRPTYPANLPVIPPGGNATVVAQFVVDPSGHADMRTWWVSEATNDAFAASAWEAVRTGMFTPAEVGGRRVRQLMRLPFTYTLQP